MPWLPGSDAARTVSQLVLLDSNFASMPRVVQEGRRSINNLQRSASLFLVKSIFSVLLAFFFIFIPRDYPFEPIQMTLISALTIGAPSFILALEPNRERIQGKFIINVLQKALPAALTIVLNILLLTAVSGLLGLSEAQLSTLSVYITGGTGLMMLFRVCSPFNFLRGALWGVMTAAFILAAVFFGQFFQPGSHDPLYGPGAGSHASLRFLLHGLFPLWRGPLAGPQAGSDFHPNGAKGTALEAPPADAEAPALPAPSQFTKKKEAENKPSPFLTGRVSCRYFL